jgi:hypothetical protein
MSIQTLTVDRLDAIRPGDAILAIDGHRLGYGPRLVRAILADGQGWNTEPPYEGSAIEWNIYRGSIHESVTVSPAPKPRVRTFKTADAAAKAWGNAHGIYNRGGSLYWDAETREQAYALARGTGLGVKRIERRGYSRLVGDMVTTEVVYLVTGYGRAFRGQDSWGHRNAATYFTKGWAALAETMLANGLLEQVDGRYQVVSR